MRTRTRRLERLAASTRRRTDDGFRIDFHFAKEPGTVYVYHDCPERLTEAEYADRFKGRGQSIVMHSPGHSSENILFR